MVAESIEKRIAKGLVSLLREKPLDKISVGDISAAAGVSRQTFYYHFDNIFSIYRWAVCSKIPERHAGGRGPAFLGTLDDLYHALLRNRALTLAFFKSRYTIECLDMVRDILRPVAIEAVSYRMDGSFDRKECRICSDFLVGGNLNIIVNWIDNDMATPLEDIYGAVNSLLQSIMTPEAVEALTGKKNAVR